MNKKHIEKQSTSARREGRTDWARVDSMTDEEIEANVRDDADAELLNAEWFRTAELIVPDLGKERITIRVDRDVVDYFREEGPGYQSRMNAVLKAFVLARRLKEQEEKP